MYEWGRVNRSSMTPLLIIDDEPAICWGLAELGKRLGHQVQTASSAEQGLQLAELERPAVILLDVRLPGMDGLAATKILSEKLTFYGHP